jgi:arylsulfatase A-like enzyme
MPAPPSPSGPNVLVILTTQWRGQALGCAGDPNARTPQLDALAAQAVHFTQAVTPHPFGPFARAAFLTGLPSPENGVADYFDPLPRDRPTLARAFEARGYATAFFGHWHLAPRDPTAALVGEAHARTRVAVADRGGFGYWDGFQGGYQINHPWLHGTTSPEPRRLSGYQSDILVEVARRWISSARAPWFCLLSLEPPHPPYAADAAGIAPRDPQTIQLPGNVPRGDDRETRARRELGGYYAHIEATDRALGRIIGAVPASTRLVFTSVHGDMHGAHGRFRKGWPYEESVRIPLLWREPGGPRAVCRPQPLSLLDLGPGLLAPAGAGLPEPNSPAPISMPSVVRLPDQCDRTWRGLRGAERKLVLGEDGAPWLFFDLKNDPLEQHNLAADPARAGEIRDWANLIHAGRPPK